MSHAIPITTPTSGLETPQLVGRLPSPVACPGSLHPLTAERVLDLHLEMTEIGADLVFAPISGGWSWNVIGDGVDTSCQLPDPRKEVAVREIHFIIVHSSIYLAYLFGPVRGYN